MQRQKGIGTRRQSDSEADQRAASERERGRAKREREREDSSSGGRLGALPPAVCLSLRAVVTLVLVYEYGSAEPGTGFPLQHVHGSVLQIATPGTTRYLTVSRAEILNGC